MSDPLTFKLPALQAAAKALLEANAYFADIPVLTELIDDIDNEIERALGNLAGKDGKVGICVIAMTPKASCKNQEAPGPILDPLSLILHVTENVGINGGTTGTLKPALQVVEMCLRLLHRKALTGVNSCLVVGATPFRLISSTPIIYEVNFESKLVLKPEV